MPAQPPATLEAASDNQPLLCRASPWLVINPANMAFQGLQNRLARSHGLPLSLLMVSAHLLPQEVETSVSSEEEDETEYL